MRRRDLLAKTTIGLGLVAGCVGRTGQTAGSQSTPTPDDPPAEMSPRYEIDPQVDEPTRDGLRLTLSADVDTIEGDQAGVLVFSVTNSTDEHRQVMGGAVWPFGVVYASATEGDGRFLLWRQEYEENSNVRVEDGNVSVAQIGVQNVIEAGETVSREYTVPPDTDGLEPGRYALVNASGGLVVGDVRFQVELDVTPVDG